MPQVSIVIPSYLRHDKLDECLKSIVEFTDLSQVECIVVANGAAVECRAVCTKYPVKLLWFDEPLGYPKACNAGIRASSAEYVVLLNDDCQILPSPKNHWIDVLLKPFLEDGKVGISGPQRNWDENSGYHFLVFFCVMLRRECLDQIGLLDESTGIGFGEDTIACIEAEYRGWKVVQVPDNDKQNPWGDFGPESGLEEWKWDKINVGDFPLWHDAESTMIKLPNTEDLLRKNRALLRERYNREGINIDRARVTDGWIGLDELVWLARQAKTHKLVGEVGSWHGKSSRALADNLMFDGGKLICCDTWCGSSGEPEMHGSAKLREGDHAFQWWWSNLHNEIMVGTVIPIRMHSTNAAEVLNSLGLKLDMLFIDADHTYEAVRADILAWAPLMKDGALFCGHDFYPEGKEPFAWMGVRQAVQELFPDAQKTATSIWWSTSNPLAPKGRGHVYDCCIYFNEQDLLELRFRTLDEVVDRFVIVEGTKTHSGLPKPLYFNENLERFRPWLHKVTHIVVDDYPEPSSDAWVRERFQRDAIMRGLTECRANDIILIGDADEIANPEAVKNYDVSQGLCRLKQRLFYYYLNCENKEGWDWLKIAPYKTVKELTPCGVRYPPSDAPMIENGGWHFSFCTTTAGIINKVRSYAHAEYATDEILDLDRIAKLKDEGRDIFGRDLQYEFVAIDENYPKYVWEHVPDYISKGMIKLPQLGKVLFPGQSVTPLHLVSGESVDLIPPTGGLKGTITVEGKSATVNVMSPTVTAEVSTKDRYTTTLPMTIAAILNQTRKPERLVIYDDGEQKDLRELSPFDNLLKLATDRGIEWEVMATPRKGQVSNHQHCLENAKTEYIWRVDDDEIPAPDCLGYLLSCMGQNVGAGAVGGLVHHPGSVGPPPNFLDGSLKDVQAGMNLQWFQFNGAPKQVEHLYSTFLYSVEAGKKAGGYPKTLSPIGHREETIFSHLIYRAGYKVLIESRAKTYHLRESSGGIRSYQDQSLWEQDEKVFQSYLNEWGSNGKPSKLICADFGLGDHLLLKGVWPEIRRRNPDKEFTLALCFPEVFEDVPNVKIISIADAHNILGPRYDEALLYRWCWEHNWTRPMTEAMIEFWGS